LIIGVSVGWFLTFAQLYVHEAAPAHLRGIVFAVYQSMLSIGSIVGAAVDFGTHDFHGRRAYQVPLAIFFVAPTLQAVLMFFFAPESPRWLMVQRKEDEAEASLRKLRNSNIDELEFQAEFNEIRQSTREQLEQNKKYLFLEMWRGTNLRRTLLSIAVVCFHAANGYVIWKNASGFFELIQAIQIELDQHLHNVLPTNRWGQAAIFLLDPCHLHRLDRRYLQFLLRPPR
jgi:MFS family permease